MAQKTGNELYSDFHNIEISYFKELVDTGKISLKLANKLIDYWEMRITEDRDLLYHNYFEFYLFFESINSGILAAFIYDEDEKRVIHQYGVLGSVILQVLEPLEEGNQRTTQLIAGQQETLHHQGQDLQYYAKSIDFGKNHYLLGVMYPTGLEMSEKIARLENVFKRYYLPDIFKPDHRFKSLFETLENDIVPMVQEYLKKNKPVTFTHFVFESFNKYITLAGEHFGLEIVTGIYQQLNDMMKGSDRCFVLNPREYLVISPECEKKDLQQRFKRHLFQVKSLFLNHRVKYTTRQLPITDLSSIWHEISL